MKKVKLASIPLLKLAYQLVGKKVFKSTVNLVDDRTLAGIEPPYILLSNHCSFVDVGGLGAMLLPKTGASFVASKTQFAKWGRVLTSLGVIGKKQFTVDASVIRDIKQVLTRNRPVIIYPEAKLSVDGTPCIIPLATAKLVKMMRVPLVTVNFCGSYLAKPRWSEHYRRLDVVPTVTELMSVEDIASSSVEDIHNALLSALDYDDYQYQRDNNIAIEHPHLVEGLDNILMICSHCNSMYTMTSRGNTLQCQHCLHEYTMDKYGVIHGGQYDSVPSWYGMIRDKIASLVDSGQYREEHDCRVEIMTKNRFVKAGKGKVVHDATGIHLYYKDINVEWGNVFYTLSFDNQYVYLPTSSAIYRISIGRAGVHAVMNIATELLYNRTVSSAK